jgi:hypothetical protein
MQKLGDLFSRDKFDVVVSCMALDNILSDDGIHQAVQAMHDVLKPGGRCYLRLRDFDHLLRVRPRYDFREERELPHGRVIRLEDWLYESERHVVNAWIFLREDTRKDGYPWDTVVLAYRRRALRKIELHALLHRAGFDSVTFLPQSSPWDPFEVVAERTKHPDCSPGSLQTTPTLQRALPHRTSASGSRPCRQHQATPTRRSNPDKQRRYQLRDETITVDLRGQHTDQQIEDYNPRKAVVKSRPHRLGFTYRYYGRAPVGSEHKWSDVLRAASQSILCAGTGPDQHRNPASS